MTDSNGCQRWEYMGAQSTDCCFVAGACMMKEKETMASVPFQHYACTMLVIAKDKIPAAGDEPAFPPQKHMTGTGDLAYQQKSSGEIDRGCKGKHDFCTHCTCTSAQHDFFSYVTGERRCARNQFARRGSTTCPCRVDRYR